MLDLTQSKLATQEDIASGLLYWAMLFKAKTWEELKMLSKENEVFEDVAVTMAKSLENKDILLRLEARERYERNMLSSYEEGIIDSEKAFSTLYANLEKLGRLSDFAKCMTDAEYRHQLFEEFNIKFNNDWFDED